METWKWVLVAVGMIVFGAIFNRGPVQGTETAVSAAAPATSAENAWEAKPAKTVEPEGGLVLSNDWKYVPSGFGTVKIVGTVTNNTGRDIGYAQISFTGFDKSGAQVDTALANMANLKVGARWRFEAVSFKQGGVWRYELGELIGN